MSVLHVLWQRLPYQIRRRLLFSVADGLAYRGERFPDPLSGPVVVAGFLRTASGLGESARLCLQILKTLGYDVRGLDLSGGMLMQARELSEAYSNYADAGPGSGTIIVHTNGPLMGLTLLNIDRKIRKGKRVIGYWAWELPELPDEWIPGLRFVDEIWTPSAFVAQAVSPHCECPVRVVPHPVQIPRTAVVRNRSLRSEDGCFVVLVAFNMASSFARKNPIASIEAFKKAFGDSPGARLVVKVHNPGSDPAGHSAIIKAVSGSGNISLMDRTVDRDGMSALIQESSVVLSLHRSEGFGLILAEAMLLGKPVVATGWSGNMDFMNDTNSFPVACELVHATDPCGYYEFADQEWAEPNVMQAAQFLRNLYEDRGLYTKISEEARRSSKEFFSPKRYGELVTQPLTLSDRVSV